MSIYTRTGDDGGTGIVGGRTSKSSVQVEAYGTIEEANSFIGVAAALLTEKEADIKTALVKIQHELFDCGSDLSFKDDIKKTIAYKVKEDTVKALEEHIDFYNEGAPALERFILPGGTPAAAYLHTARTVIRRAERRVVQLANEAYINPCVRQYLNRLSDYLFVICRVVNARAGQKDIEYERGEKVFRNVGRGEE
ncbi:cob(I)yrinic acid a,c-diamide adenosyltransferase [Salicibibacter cibi]|uniref:Corrinoid adenosyltransferase n=1 Tax=Salicibibacter cibi TaxID=2743001 RepID=A0A7T7CE00_9BACI|nr:cob(I)yrinic acid a,c-diamide adenosyltransferase [Salicibibacter cibi]QQK78543.1 cob(I)yrinic acid a,c-diamide adenosyltransferase [Salicibibacter cibi]